ncbi:hypothetical protein [Rothia sp. CCM 9416]|uniref:hypothetical protein n=1 Tax=Rothia sp. CCM 9416 TaxID=3402655 RepID=UPI003AECABED
MKTKITDRFVDLYNLSFYLLVMLALVGSISYALKQLRGHYLYFTLDDAQAPGFFLGALLIVVAAFVTVLGLLGPVAYSPSQLFWRYSGLIPASKNPWKQPAMWGALGLWALVVTSFAIIFTPLTPPQLCAVLTAACLYGAVLVHGAIGVQASGHWRLLAGWGVLALVTGLGLVLATTCDLLPGYDPTSTAQLCAAGILGSGFLGALAYGLAGTRTNLTWYALTSAYGRSAILFQGLRNLGGADGYRYYGSQSVRFRRRVLSARPLLLSLAALADSTGPFFLILVLTIPFAILGGVALGQAGASVVIAVGAWMVASLYRWLTREWAANLPLRGWLSAPYFSTVLGFAGGATLAASCYVLVMALIFQLPLLSALTGFIFGLATALGEHNPPLTYNYDLVITLPEGLVIPIEPASALFRVMLEILSVSLLLGIGKPWAVLIPLGILGSRLYEHYRKGHPAH